jgi:rhodanese-related sulfurtransferase
MSQPLPAPLPPELSVNKVAERLRAGGPLRLIDVRQLWEREIVALPDSEPLDEVLLDDLLKNENRDSVLIFSYATMECAA